MLESLEKYNDRAAREYHDRLAAKPNGLECPKCYLELWDMDPREVLASAPPQTRVECLACGYKGYRVVGGTR